MQESLLAQQAEPIDITTPEQLADLTIAWFVDCKAQVDYVLTVPDDVNIKMVVDGVERELTPSERQIYKQGVATVSEIFKQLPFFASEVNDGEANKDTGV